MYKQSIFWFRQDLRVRDNTALFEAVKNSSHILPIFILDTHIIDSFWWLQDTKFGFIRESLDSLSTSIHSLWWEKVIVCIWAPEDIIPKLVQKYNIEAIYCNKSYGTYGTKRDAKIQALAQNIWCFFHSFKDYLLVEPYEIEQRKVFTPFYKLWQKKVEYLYNYVWRDRIEKISQLPTEEQSEAKDFISLTKHPFFTIDFWNIRIKKYIRPDYKETRNSLDIDGTSKISPYLRFWVFSPREIYITALQNNGLQSQFISELAWREFWRAYFPLFSWHKTKGISRKKKTYTVVSW